MQPASSPPTSQSLPTRDIGDVALAAALDRAGCPLCYLRQETARRFLASVLWESVNDPNFRKRLTVARGFCRPHARDVLKADREQGGTIGAAILYASAIRVRLGELDGLQASQGKRQQAALRTAGAPPNCPVCEHVRTSDGIAVARLVELVDQAAWSRALTGTAFCLDDLLLVWTRAAHRRATSWTAVADGQLARLRALVERLDAFAHHSSYDRRHLMTDPERAAAEEAQAFLGGLP